MFSFLQRGQLVKKSSESPVTCMAANVCGNYNCVSECVGGMGRWEGVLGAEGDGRVLHVEIAFLLRACMYT